MIESFERGVCGEESHKAELKSKIEAREMSIEARERQKETVNVAVRKSLEVQIRRLKDELRSLETQLEKAEREEDGAGHA